MLQGNSKNGEVEGLALALNHLKNDFEAALFEAATEAAIVVASVLKPGKTAYEPFEKEQLEIALKLLVIMQGFVLPKLVGSSKAEC